MQCFFLQPNNEVHHVFTLECYAKIHRAKCPHPSRTYLANADESVVTRATPHCDRTVREAWIRTKYVDRAFVRKLSAQNVPGSPATKWSVQKRKHRSTSQDKVSCPTFKTIRHWTKIVAVGFILLSFIWKPEGHYGYVCIIKLNK